MGDTTASRPLSEELNFMVKDLENFPINEPTTKRKTRQTPTHNTPPAKKSANKSANKSAKSTPIMAKSPTLEQIQSMMQNLLSPIANTLDELNKSHTELQWSHKDLRDGLESQNIKINKLDADISENKTVIQRNSTAISDLNNRTSANEERIERLEKDNDDLRREIDDLRLSSLEKGALLTGTLIQQFITDHPDMPKTSLYKDNPILAELHAKLTQSFDASQSSAENLRCDELDYIIKANSTKLIIQFTSRNTIHKLFKISKSSNRAFYVAEQLTKPRQNILYDIRKYLRDKLRNTSLRASSFSRNDVPMVIIGSDDPRPIRNQAELRNLFDDIDARV